MEFVVIKKPQGVNQGAILFCGSRVLDGIEARKLLLSCDTKQQEHRNMPIMKETSARLVKESVPYEIVSRDVVQSITNPCALAIYTYLMTLPANWVVRRKHIIEHFDGLGRERYDAAMKQLKELGVVWVYSSKDAVGQFTDNVIVVETVPKVGKPALRETPTLGKTDHIEIQTLPKDTDITLSKGKRFARPTLDEVKIYCAEKGYTVDPERFINHYESNGWKVGKNSMKSWHAALANWNKTEKQNGQNRKSGRGNSQGIEVITADQLLNQGHDLVG